MLVERQTMGGFTMKRSDILLLVLTAVLCTGIEIVESQTIVEKLPANFADRAFKHVEFLASMGHRQVGSENDEQTIRYVREQFSRIGLSVEVQPFQFASFEYNDAEFRVNNRRLDVYALGLPPSPATIYTGTAILIDWETFDASNLRELKGKRVITNDWSAHFRLLPVMPELVVYLHQSEFAKIQKAAKVDFSLRISGRRERFASANVIARLGHAPPSKKEILVTAHLDTYRRDNPGASDNASGIGVMIELARYFKQREDDLPCIVKFIAFGGEEVGIIGSRQYVAHNRQSLEQCELLFNIDDVGGHRNIVVEKTGGVSGAPRQKGWSQIPDHMKNSSWEGVSSMWRMLPQDNDMLEIIAAGNHPDWLVGVVEQSINELGYEVVYTGTQGSDQIAFAQAGIVTSGVGIIGDYQHSPEDKPAYINTDSLRKAGEIALHIVMHTMKRIAREIK